MLAGDAKGMNEAVAELIGLPFRHFTRCVILPQGEFAQFLHDKPSDRQDLLVKLLDLGVYERMRRRAAQVADEKANEVALDEKMIERFADCTPDALEAAKAEVVALGLLRTRLDDAEPRVAELTVAAETAIAAAQSAVRVVALLQVVSVPKQARSLHAERDQRGRGAERRSRRGRSGRHGDDEGRSGRSSCPRSGGAEGHDRRVPRARGCRRADRRDRRTARGGDSEARGCEGGARSRVARCAPRRAAVRRRDGRQRGDRARGRARRGRAVPGVRAGGHEEAQGASR